MYVRELKLTNVRQFAERNFSFQPGFNLIVGENGAGKTTLLRSLQAVLARSTQSRQRLALGDNDIRLRSETLRIVAELATSKSGEINSATYIRQLGHRAYRQREGNAPKVLSYASNEATSGNLISPRARRYDGQEFGGGKSSEEWLFQQQVPPMRGDRMQPHFGRSEDIRSFVLKILSEFSPRFHDFKWSFEPFNCTVLPADVGPHTKLNDPRLKRFLQSAIMRYLLEARNPFANMDVEWVILRSDGFAQDSGNRRRITPSFRELMKPTNASDEDLQFYDQSAAKISIAPRVRIRDRSGDTFLLSQLSDGEQRLFSLVVDIARQLSLEAPDNKLFAEIPAVVLIDEIDVHLHPKWQRKIVPLLEDLFPACQFIATTHSPFVVQAVPENKVQHLNGEILGSFTDRGIEEIASKVMGIDDHQVGVRYLEMLDTAREFFRVLEIAQSAKTGERSKLKQRLNELSQRYARNPAFQAYLELHGALTLGADELR